MIILFVCPSCDSAHPAICLVRLSVCPSIRYLELERGKYVDRLRHRNSRHVHHCIKVYDYEDSSSVRVYITIFIMVIFRHINVEKIVITIFYFPTLSVF